MHYSFPGYFFKACLKKRSDELDISLYKIGALKNLKKIFYIKFLTVYIKLKTEEWLQDTLEIRKATRKYFGFRCCANSLLIVRFDVQYVLTNPW